MEDFIDVHTLFFALLALFVVARPKFALHVAADAFEGAGGDDRLRRTADSHEEVDAGIGLAGREGASDVAVWDEADTRVERTYLFDKFLVARPVKDDDRDVFHRFSQRARDGSDVVGRRGVDVDRVCRVGAGGYLVHIEDMLRIEERIPLREGHDADGVRKSEGGEARAVDRVYRYINLRFCSAAQLFAVEKHRRFVFLAFTNNNYSVHIDGIENKPHRVDRSSVNAVLIPASHPAACGHSGGFCRPYHLKR